MDEQSIFLEALARETPEELASYLGTACGEDSALRQRVEKLLEINGRSNDFMQHPAVSVTLVSHAISEKLGDRIGSYKLREQIGEGGFGVVYVAEQTEPVARKVALKVIKPGMDTKDVIARFEAERQALALMDHPHVAKVFDAGTTETGLPYFVMELVRGIPITRFCDEGKLNTEDRLRLMVDLCHAVQHAHQKGIIHRDLKPSNILVTMRDDRPAVKVIDFGVAKALHQRLTEKTVYTAYGQMVGTPMYMSPEQAQMNEFDVDTRSDVYSLGVLLYELLTGATPFGKDVLKKSGIEELRRIIREDDPPRPSHRVSTLAVDDLATASDCRRIDPRKLSQTLTGELDWIVMRALEKDRNRRYESATAFAADVERYLNDEAVEACPPSLRYRLGKYVRRHKGMLTTAALVLLTMLAGVALAGWQAMQAIESRNLAQERQRQSDVNYRRSLDVINRMLQRVGGETLFAVPGMLPIQRQLLEDAVAFYEEMISENADDPDVRHMAAAAYMSLAAVNGQLGIRRKDYLVYLSRSVELLEQICQTHPERTEYAARLADAYWWLGNATADADAKEDIYRRGIDVATIVAKKEPRSAYLLSKLCRMLAERRQKTDPEEAQRLFLRAIDAAETIGHVSTLAPARWRFARFLSVSGLFSEAEREFQSAISTFRQGLADDPIPYSARNLRFSVLLTRKDLGLHYVRSGQIEKAEQELRPAADAVETLSQEFPETERYLTLLLSIWSELIAVLNTQGRTDEAESLTRKMADRTNPQSAAEYLKRAGLYLQLEEYEQALRDYTQAIELEPTSAYYKRRAAAYFALQDFDLALADLTQAVELNPGDTSNLWSIPPTEVAACPDEEFRNGVLGLADRTIELTEGSANAYQARGFVLRSLRHLDRALADYERAIEIDPENESLHSGRAFVFAEQGDWPNAASGYLKAAELQPDSYVNWYWYALASLGAQEEPAYTQACAEMLQQFGESETSSEANFTAWTRVLAPDALDDFAPALALTRKAVEQEPENRQYLNTLGAVLFRAGRFEEALKQLNAAVKLDESGNTSAAYEAYFLALTHHHLGHAFEAGQWLERADEQAEAEASSSRTPLPWNRRLTLELLRAEATELLRHSTPNPDPEKPTDTTANP